MLQEIAEIYLSNAEMYPSTANADIYQLCWLYMYGTANDTEIDILKKYFGM